MANFRTRCAGEGRAAGAVSADQIEVDILPFVAPLERVGASDERHHVFPVPVPVHLPFGSSEGQVGSAVTRSGSYPTPRYPSSMLMPMSRGGTRSVAVRKESASMIGNGRFVQERRAEGVGVSDTIVLDVRDVAFSARNRCCPGS